MVREFRSGIHQASHCGLTVAVSVPSINDCPATNLTPCSGIVACGSSETNAD